MTSLDQVVDISISRSSIAVSRAGFGIPLIMAAATGILNAGEVGVYTSLEGMTDEGFLTSSSAYKMASAIFSQDPHPEQILVAPTSTPVAQVNTLTPTALNSTLYSVTINGVLFSYTSDASATVAEIVAGLIAAINAGSEPVTASGTSTLILTSDTAGLGFSVAVTSNIANVATTPSNGIADDIADALATNPNFYGILIEDRAKADILQAATYVETIKRLLFVCNGDAAVKNGTADNTLEDLEALNLDRTAFLFSEGQATFPEAAWMGDTFPLEPGSVSFDYRNLKGQVADVLTATQQTYIYSKNGNTYEELGGVDISNPGKVVSGEWIDIIRDIDWLEVRIQEDIYSLLVNSDKVPFTDAGGTLLGNTIQKRLEEAVKRGILASYTLTVPKVADIPSEDRAARFFTGITFTGILQGGINKVRIRGTVSV